MNSEREESARWRKRTPEPPPVVAEPMLSVSEPFDPSTPLGYAEPQASESLIIDDTSTLNRTIIKASRIFMIAIGVAALAVVLLVALRLFSGEASEVANADLAATSSTPNTLAPAQTVTSSTIPATTQAPTTQTSTTAQPTTTVSAPGEPLTPPTTTQRDAPPDSSYRITELPVNTTLWRTFMMDLSLIHI